MKKTYKTCPAENVVRLTRLVGAPKAADQLGVSASLVNRVVRSGVCSFTLDLAARGLLAGSERNMALINGATTEQLAVLKGMVDQMPGVTLQPLE